MSTQMRADAEPLFDVFLDDAAMFPPGNLPLENAVHAHVRHLRGAHAGMVGPLVLAAKELGRLAIALGDVPLDDGGLLEIAVTVPLPRVAEAVSGAGGIRGARLTRLEIALLDDTRPGDVVPALRGSPAGDEVVVFVEVPRDGRRAEVLTALAGTPYLAKFRTGGVHTDLYPDEQELAEIVLAAVRAGVPFKATAGLHHALRNTDPVSGFEQHGFLNLLAATSAGLEGRDLAELTALLADRDGRRIVDLVGARAPQVREAVRSIGTCSIAEPVEELIGLGMLTPHLTKDLA